MKIKIISISKTDKNLEMANEDYIKRLKKYCKYEEVVLDNYKFGEKEKILKEEAKSIKKHLNSKDYIILLDLQGVELSSVQLAEKINSIQNEASSIVFIIGGSYGVDEEIKKLADFRMSFSKLTFPHKIFKLILLEQIYRSFKILNNEEYHK